MDCLASDRACRSVAGVKDRSPYGEGRGEEKK